MNGGGRGHHWSTQSWSLLFVRTFRFCSRTLEDCLRLSAHEGPCAAISTSSPSQKASARKYRAALVQLLAHLPERVRQSVKSEVDVDIDAGGGSVRAVAVQKVEDGGGTAHGESGAGGKEGWQRAQHAKVGIHGSPGRAAGDFMSNKVLVCKNGTRSLKI